MALDIAQIKDEKAQAPNGKANNRLRDIKKQQQKILPKPVIDDREIGDDAARIERIFNQQRTQQKALVQELREMLQELHALKREMENVSHTATQMALQGATKAQADMVDRAKETMEKVTKENLRQIDSLVQESQKRIERLKKTTLVERLNPAAIWVTLLMILGMLTYHIVV